MSILNYSPREIKLLQAGALAGRPAAAEENVGHIYYATDAKQSYICAYNGSSSFAWRPINGGERFVPTINTKLLYRLNETSGNITNYGSSASAELTPAAGYSYSSLTAASTIGKGAGCTGASDSYAEGGGGVEPGSGDITVFCVASLNNYASGFSAGMFLTREWGTPGGAWSPPWISLMLHTRASPGTWGCDFSVAGTYYTCMSNSNYLSLNRQHVLVWTRNATTGATQLYLDGNAVTTTASGSPTGSIDWGTSGGVWRIGAGGPTERLDGTVLEAGVEDTLWTASQVKEHYQRTIGTYLS